jgi:hypothetical protein
MSAKHVHTYITQLWSVTSEGRSHSENQGVNGIHALDAEHEEMRDYQLIKKYLRFTLGLIKTKQSVADSRRKFLSRAFVCVRH